MTKGFSAYIPDETPQFTLGDDGTVDTVIDCRFCEHRERFNFASSCEQVDEESGSEDDNERAYNDFVAECIAFCIESHECENEEE